MSIDIRIGGRGCAAIAVTAVITVSANAAVTRWNCNLNIPATSAGLFINVQTQVSGTTTAAVLGWDFNLYTTSQSTASLTMYGYLGTKFMRAPDQFGYWPGNLPAGTLVGPPSSWLPEGQDYSAVFSSVGQAGNWNYNSTNYFGFKFQVSTGATHYGYGRMDVGANANIRTLKWIEWETTPQTGLPVVPAPGILAAIGLVRCISLRRRS